MVVSPGQPDYGSLSLALATHVAWARFEDLPATTVSATKRALLDGVGVMLAASGLSADVEPFIAQARAMGGPREAAVLGTREWVSAAAAALANGSMAHALDYEDAFDRAALHPNASLIPAALAIAQARGDVTGEELVAAIAIGCDLVCRLGLSLRQPLEVGGWYPPPILGAFGAIAAAARLMRLEPGQVLDAWSIGLCQTACPGEIQHSRTSVIRAIREAFPAQGAVLAVQLAARGIKGFEAPLEGRAGFFRLFCGGQFDAGPLLEELGRVYWIEQLSFKPWPCCRGTHAYIEAAQRLREDHALSWREVTRVRLAGGSIQQMLADPPQRKRAPATSIEAKFSLPFVVASALVQPEVTLASFSAEALRDADVLSLAARVEFERLADWGLERAAAGRVSVELADRRSYSVQVDQARGHPDRPLTDEQLCAKFIECACNARVPWSDQQARRACEQLLQLEYLERPLEVLAGH